MFVLCKEIAAYPGHGHAGPLLHAQDEIAPAGGDRIRIELVRDQGGGASAL
jgi:hypothetical protein